MGMKHRGELKLERWRALSNALQIPRGPEGLVRQGVNYGIEKSERLLLKVNGGAGKTKRSTTPKHIGVYSGDEFKQKIGGKMIFLNYKILLICIFDYMYHILQQLNTQI